MKRPEVPRTSEFLTFAAQLVWLRELLPQTRCALDEGAGGRPEGMVLRTLNRSIIVKLRFEDYERTLRGLDRGGR